MEMFMYIKKIELILFIIIQGSKQCYIFDVGQNLLFNFCNYYLILIFLCKIRYFRFRLFISMFLGVFNVFRLNLILVMVRYQLGVILKYIFLFVKFYEVLKQTPKSVNVFSQIIINKIAEYLLNFFLVDSSLSSSRFRDPLWI